MQNQCSLVSIRENLCKIKRLRSVNMARCKLGMGLLKKFG